jgi:hypothetical protein
MNFRKSHGSDMCNSVLQAAAGAAGLGDNGASSGKGSDDDYVVENELERPGCSIS